MGFFKYIAQGIGWQIGSDIAKGAKKSLEEGEQRRDQADAGRRKETPEELARRAEQASRDAAKEAKRREKEAAAEAKRKAKAVDDELAALKRKLGK